MKRLAQMEVDSGVQSGSTTDQSLRTKELEREVQELKRTNKILRIAAAFYPSGFRSQTRGDP
jgi:transposase